MDMIDVNGLGDILAAHMAETHEGEDAAVMLKRPSAFGARAIQPETTG